MRVDDLRLYLKETLAAHQGTTRRRNVPTSTGEAGGHRLPERGSVLLGIPVALDRFIQQPMLEVLTPIFDPHFSESSHGFPAG